MIKTPLELLKESIEATLPDTPDAREYQKAVLEAIEILLPTEIERCVLIFQTKKHDTTSNQGGNFYAIEPN